MSYPFTETGFAGGNKSIVPEYKTRSRLRFNNGDKIYVVDSINGEKRITYTYNKRLGWIREGDNIWN